MSRVQRLFDHVCDLPADQRDAALQEKGVDADTHARVMALLEASSLTRTCVQEPMRQGYPSGHESELATGATLDAWRLLREIGHGGMGSVFLAERADGHFTQQAAIKLIRGFADADMAAHFSRERQLLADLQHPQIARLLDGGATPQGLPYLVMEYVEGESIDAWCRNHEPDLDARLRVFASVCAAVQYAHQHRVAHCDLKPSNVLVRDDGTPVLLDFGIAHAIDPHANSAEHAGGAESTAAARPSSDTDSSHNSRGTPTSRLTPRYASPEQLRGEMPTLTSDIYSLGLMLYALVCAQPPTRGGRETAPVPSETAGNVPWKRRLRGDIDAIVARACAVDPTQRYASAQALAEDVQRIGRHEPVQARTPHWHYLCARMLRRRWPVFAVATLILLIAAVFAWRIVLAEQEARIEAETAERATDFIVSVFAASDSNVSSGALHVLSAREVLDNGHQRVNKELADQPAIRARLLEALGEAYRHMSLGHIAAPLLREAADLNLSLEVNKPLAAARSLEALTNTLANGEFPSADIEKVAMESLALNRKLSAPDSQEVANALMVLSLALNRSGKYEEALEAAHATLAINKLKRSKNRLGAAYGNLILIHSAHGDYEKAASFLEPGFATATKNSVVHTLRLSARARLHMSQGDAEGALKDMRQALAMISQLQGETGAFAAYYRVTLGQLLIHAGHYAEADVELARALRDEEALTGKDSGEYLAAVASVASNRLAQGLIDIALDMRRDIHRRRLALYGAEDPRLLSAASQLAEALIVNHQANAEAHQLIEATLAQWAAKGETHAPQSLQAMQLLARWHLANHDAASALPLLDQVDASSERLPIQSSIEQLALRASAARVQGDLDHALRLDQQSLDQHLTALLPAHPRTALRALAWARDLRSSSDNEHALQLEREWRPRLESALPADSVYLREVPD